MSNTRFKTSYDTTSGEPKQEAEKTKYTIINTNLEEQGSDILQTDIGNRVNRIKIHSQIKDEKKFKTNIVINVDKEKLKEMYFKLNDKLEVK